MSSFRVTVCQCAFSISILCVVFLPFVITNLLSQVFLLKTSCFSELRLKLLQAYSVRCRFLCNNLCRVLFRSVFLFFCCQTRVVTHYLVKWRGLPYEESTWELPVCILFALFVNISLSCSLWSFHSGWP